jgi:hypothetical protein
MLRYGESVFINCPFDAPYRALLDVIVFAVHDCGLVARSALEIQDTGEVRLHKILGLIRRCKFGIHDISRTEVDPKTHLPRFNMPLELGLFLGAKAFGDRSQRRKVCLVLDRHRYRYTKFCSDIAGQDPAAHSNRPLRAVIVVRNWLQTHSRYLMPGGKAMAERYRLFTRALPAMCTEAKLDPKGLIFVDYSALVVAWLKENPW